MTAKTAFARRALAVLIVVLSLFPRASTKAASVSLAWDPSPSPTVTGYVVFYGSASGDYTLSINVGTNTALTVPGLTAGLTYYLAVLAYDSNQDNSLLSNEVIDGPLTLTTEPLAQSVSLGATASFAVSATGTAPLAYQWFDGAAALAGATNATLTLLNVSNANAGNYSVVITNNTSSVASSLVTLSVVNLPVITSQPIAQTVAPGALAYFNVGVQGAGPFTYLWFYNGTALNTGLGLNFLLITASVANLGNYSVAVANSNGSVTSSVATLSIIGLPMITSQPVAQSVVAGATASFAVSATGTAPLAYQWFDGATALSFATNATLTLPNVSAAYAGNYSVVITNSAGSVTSSVITLSVINLPVIASQPVSQTVAPGALAFFQVAMNGAGPFTYQWLHNGTALSSGPGLSFLVVSATPVNLGNYSVAIANGNGSVTSIAAELQTPGPPALTIAKSGNGIIVSWSSSATGFLLQQNSNLATTNWTASDYAISTNAATESITISSPSGNLFFRLFHP